MINSLRLIESEKSDDDKWELWAEWYRLVNMSESELKNFYDSEEGKEAGLSSKEADKEGIDYGRESARWLMKMIPKGQSWKSANENWTDKMWKWAGKQVSFISRMSGVEGPLFDENDKKTRKHTSLLIWGHNPKKNLKKKPKKTDNL